MADDATVGPPHIAGLSYEGVLGAGGFADVYRYEQLALGRDVAVKVIHGLGDAARAQFTAEANVMARLSSHPFVVPIYQVGESDDGRPYLVMQLCPSPTLATRLGAGPLPVADVLRIGVQLAGAVETAHRMGILHRDIKPANILFSEYGHPLLTDFGIAQSLEHAEPVLAFTPSYAPPEQMTGHPSAPAVDVYALCATLWAALTGEPPQRPAAAGVTRASLGRGDVPAVLEDVLLAGLARDPADRHPTALALGRALQRVQSHLGLPATTIELWDGGAGHDTQEVAPPDARTHLVALDVAPTLTDAEPAPAAGAPTTPAAATPAASPVPDAGSTPAQSAPAAAVWTPPPAGWMPPGPALPAQTGAPAPAQSGAQAGAPAQAPAPAAASGPAAVAHGASPGGRPVLAEGGGGSRAGVVILLVAVLVLALALVGLWRLLPGLLDGGDPAPAPTSTTTTATPRTTDTTPTTRTTRTTPTTRPSTSSAEPTTVPSTPAPSAPAASTSPAQPGEGSIGDGSWAP